MDTPDRGPSQQGNFHTQLKDSKQAGGRTGPKKARTEVPVCRLSGRVPWTCDSDLGSNPAHLSHMEGQMCSQCRANPPCSRCMCVPVAGGRSHCKSHNSTAAAGAGAGGAGAGTEAGAGAGAGAGVGQGGTVPFNESGTTCAACASSLVAQKRQRRQQASAEASRFTQGQQDTRQAMGMPPAPDKKTGGATTWAEFGVAKCKHMWAFYVECGRVPRTYVWKEKGEGWSRGEWDRRFEHLATSASLSPDGLPNELCSSCVDPARDETQVAALCRLYDLCHANRGLHKTNPSKSPHKQHYDLDWQSVAPGCSFWS
jgi:hypothetical protein